MILVRGLKLKLNCLPKQEVFQVSLACGGSPNVVIKAGPVNAFD